MVVKLVKPWMENLPGQIFDLDSNIAELLIEREIAVQIDTLKSSEIDDKRIRRGKNQRVEPSEIKGGV